MAEYETANEETPLKEGRERSVSIDDQSKSDTWYLLLIGMISVIQGIPIGFYIGTVTLSLCENNVSLGDLSKFSIVLLPYSFKVFLAPIVDSYYIEKIGKRKTYIVPCMLCAGITLVIFSSRVTELIEQKDVWTLTLYGLITLGFYSIMDVANDAWVLVIIHKRNFPVASSVQSLGGQIGFFLSFNLLLPLASVEFLNAYFYSDPVTEPIITYGEFIFVTGIVAILFSFVILACPERRSFAIETAVTSILDIIKTFKQIFINRNLMIITIFLLTFYVPFEAVLAPFVPAIVKKGFKKTTISLLATILLPFLMILTFAIGKIIKKYTHNIQIFFYCYILASLVVRKIQFDNTKLIFPVFLEINFDSESNYQSTSVYIFFFALYLATCTVCALVAWNSFIFRITHESMASTFITCMNSISSIGRLWPHVLSLLLAQYFDSRVMYGFAFIWIFGYQYFIRNYMYPLQNFNSTDFGFHAKIETSCDEFDSPPRIHED